MERNSCVDSAKIDLRFFFILFWGFSWEVQLFFLSDHATLIFNIILMFYFSLFKTQSFFYKSHLIKTIFAILTVSQFYLLLKLNN